MAGIHCKDVTSVEQLVSYVLEDTREWTHSGFAKPWFRGASNIVEHKLLPAILRGKNKGKEFELTTKFRLMAPGFGLTPPTDRIDQWLFLMQHHRAPTRLLDWTESPLFAAFFATKNAARARDAKDDAVIYAMDPMALNKLGDCIDSSGKPCFPNTWTQGRVLQTIKFAFGTAREPVINPDGSLIQYLVLPTAIYPSIVHARISSQKSCFTLHGNDGRDFETIFEGTPLINDKKLIKYRIPKRTVISVFNGLSNLGITNATIYPDLDGLAQELRDAFEVND